MNIDWRTNLDDRIERGKAFLPEVMQKIAAQNEPAYGRFCVMCGGSFTAKDPSKSTCSQACQSKLDGQIFDGFSSVLAKEFPRALAVPEEINQGNCDRVYFIRSGENGPIKIGTSADVQSRMRDLQTSSPDELSLLCDARGDARVESQIHALFAHLRMRGEWFAPEPELLDFIAALDSDGPK